MKHKFNSCFDCFESLSDTDDACSEDNSLGDFSKRFQLQHYTASEPDVSDVLADIRANLWKKQEKPVPNNLSSLCELSNPYLFQYNKASEPDVSDVLGDFRPNLWKKQEKPVPNTLGSLCELSNPFCHYHNFYSHSHQIKKTSILSTSTDADIISTPCLLDHRYYSESYSNSSRKTNFCDYIDVIEDSASVLSILKVSKNPGIGIKVCIDVSEAGSCVSSKWVDHLAEMSGKNTRKLDYKFFKSLGGSLLSFGAVGAGFGPFGICLCGLLGMLMGACVEDNK